MVYDYVFQVSPQVKYLIKEKFSEYLKYLIHVQNTELHIMHLDFWVRELSRQLEIGRPFESELPTPFKNCTWRYF